MACLRAAAVGVAVLLAAAVAPSAATAKAARSPVVDVSLQVNADQNGISTRTVLAIEAPAQGAYTRRLLAETPGTASYHAALRALLAHLGWFGRGGLAFRLERARAGAPRIQIERGRARVVFAQRPRLVRSCFASFGSCLWQIGYRNGVLLLRFGGRANVPKHIRWRLVVDLRGAQVESAAPPPVRLERRAGVDHVVWAISPEVRGAQVVAHARVQGASRHALDLVGPKWTAVRATLSYLGPALFFLSLAVITGPRRMRVLSLQDGGRLRRLAWSVIAICVAGAASWAVVAYRDTAGVWDQRVGGIRIWTFLIPALGLTGIGVFAMASITAAHLRRTRRAGAAVFSAVGIVALGWLATRPLDVITVDDVRTFGSKNQVGERWGMLGAASTAAMIAVVLAGGALVAHMRAALRCSDGRPDPEREPAVSDRVRRLRLRRFQIPGLVALGVAFLVQLGVVWLREWRQLGTDATLYGFQPRRFEPSWILSVSRQLFFWPTSTLALFVSLLMAVGLAAALSLLAATDRTPGAGSAGGDRLTRDIAIVLFAGFVVGTTGLAWSFSVPIAFLFSLLLAPAFVVLASSTESHVVQPPHPGLPSRSELAVGPGGSWWRNGVAAVRLGAVLSVLPLAYYALFLVRRLSEYFSWTDPTGGLQLLHSAVFEVLFWMVAAFCLGGLFTSLRGLNGALKGAVLALWYGAAEGLAVWLLPGGGSGWFLRFLELFLFLGVLGVLLDWQSLRSRGADWHALREYYPVRTIGGAATYLGPAIVTLAAIAAQIQGGHGQDALTQFLKNVPQLVPPLK